MKLPFALIPLVALLLFAYVYARIWRLLPFVWPVKCALELLLVAPVLLFFAQVGRHSALSYSIGHVLQTASTSWMVIMLYLFMFFAVADILRLFIPALSAYTKHSGTGTLVLVAFTTLIFITAHLQYNHKAKISLEIETSKTMEKAVKIVGISDLHLGYTIGKAELAEWVKTINAEKPDVVLIAGDMIDSDINPAIEQRMYEELAQIDAPLGVYACLGNHDHMAGAQRVSQFLAKAGVRLLTDEAQLVDNQFYIVGRDDRSNPKRKALEQITSALDKSKPILLLDHQPYQLEEACLAGADFQLSGHTHRGQIFPLNLLTDAIYEVSHGYLKKQQTHYYVSSGLGIWGGKFRIGTQSEYAVINLHAQNSKQ